jgi:hypothetical protein
MQEMIKRTFFMITPFDRGTPTQPSQTIRFFTNLRTVTQI